MLNTLWRGWILWATKISIEYMKKVYCYTVPSWFQYPLIYCFGFVNATYLQMLYFMKNAKKNALTFFIKWYWIIQMNPFPSLSKTLKASMISSSESVSFILWAIIVRNTGKSIVPFPSASSSLIKYLCRNLVGFVQVILIKMFEIEDDSNLFLINIRQEHLFNAPSSESNY